MSHETISASELNTPPSSERTIGDLAVLNGDIDCPSIEEFLPPQRSSIIVEDFESRVSQSTPPFQHISY